MATTIETLKKPNGDQVLPRTRAKAVSMESGTTVEAAIENINTTINNLPGNIKVPKKLVDLSDDSTHRLVTDEEKAAWNAKSDFSGSYNDLIDKPNIPSMEGLATAKYVDDVIDELVESGCAGGTEFVDSIVYSEEDIWSNIKTWKDAPTGFKLVPGKEYTIQFMQGDHVETYTRTCQMYVDSEGATTIYIGNKFLIEFSGNSGEPFVFGYNPDSNLLEIRYGGFEELNPHEFIKDALAKVVLTTSTLKINKIDPKYFPDGGIGYECPVVLWADVLNSSETMLYMPLNLVQGEVYDVYINEDVYTVTCQRMEQEGMYGFGIGNLGVFDIDGVSGNGEPFIFIDVYTTDGYVQTIIGLLSEDLANGAKITIEIPNVVHKIDPKFLPNGSVGYDEHTLHTIYNGQLSSYISVEGVALQMGTTYIVEWDGVKYEYEPTRFSLSDVSGVGFGYVINQVDPFTIYTPEDSQCIMIVPSISDGTMYTASVIEVTKTIHPIDPKFLPGVCLPVVEISEETVSTAFANGGIAVLTGNETEKIMDAADAKVPIIVKLTMGNMGGASVCNFTKTGDPDKEWFYSGYFTEVIIFIRNNNSEITLDISQVVENMSA